MRGRVQARRDRFRASGSLVFIPVNSQKGPEHRTSQGLPGPPHRSALRRPTHLGKGDRVATRALGGPAGFSGRRADFRFRVGEEPARGPAGSGPCVCGEAARARFRVLSPAPAASSNVLHASSPVPRAAGLCLTPSSAAPSLGDSPAPPCSVSLPLSTQSHLALCPSSFTCHRTPYLSPPSGVTC